MGSAKKCNKKEAQFNWVPNGGEGEIRTRARCYTTNPLAGDPLGPLGYFSKAILK